MRRRKEKEKTRKNQAKQKESEKTTKMNEDPRPLIEIFGHKIWVTHEKGVFKSIRDFRVYVIF